MRVAVTGAKGFLGDHLVRGFRERGDEVTPVVHESGQGTPIASFLKSKADFDVVVHAAAIRHRHGVDARSYQATNVDLIERIVSAHQGRMRRFVFVSSVGVYGFPNHLPITEAHPYAPATLYGATKVHAERRVRALAKELGFEAVIVRPTIIYGRGDSNGMLDKLAAMVRARRYLVVGSGSNVLHHTHVDDIVHGVDLASRHPQAAGDDFILAGPESTTLERLSRQVAHAVGGTVPRVHVPLLAARAIATAVDVATYRGLLWTEREPPINNEKLDVMTVSIPFDPSKARRLLGYAPRVGYERGIELTLGERPSS